MTMNKYQARKTNGEIILLVTWSKPEARSLLAAEGIAERDEIKRIEWLGKMNARRPKVLAAE